MLGRSRKHLLLGTALTGVLALTMLVTDVRATAEPGPAFPVTTGPLFNDPNGSRRDQYLIVRYLNSMLDDATTGSVVRVSSLAFSLPSTTRAMIRAYERGVHVRVVLPVEAWRGDAARRLRKVIGDDVRASSYVAACHRSCLTATSADRGIAHSKLFLFSETAGQQHVSAFTSLNLTADQSERRYQDVYTVAGDPDVFDAAAEYFDALRHDRYTPITERSQVGEHDLWFFPDRRASPGTDFYARVFADTACLGVTGAGEEGRTVILFNAAIWRSEMRTLAHRLVGLMTEGCDVRVLINVERTDQDVIHVLKQGGVPTRYLASRRAPRVHSKFIAISGLHGGAAVNTVYTGSLNPTGQAVEYSDNAMIRIRDDLDVYSSYEARFNQVWELGTSLAEYDEVDKPILTDADEAWE